MHDLLLPKGRSDSSKTCVLIYIHSLTAGCAQGIYHQIMEKLVPLLEKETLKLSRQHGLA